MPLIPPRRRSMTPSRPLHWVVLAAFVVVVATPIAAYTRALTSARVETSVPDRLTDAEFWTMVTEFSEPGGYFRSDNLVSNEVTFQHVIPELVRDRAPGGVYVGVGPDQNFTYVVAMQPKIAFVIDIRRQNMLQHLFYKALIEMSDDRADFLSRLFARPRPAGLDSTLLAGELFDAFQSVPPDSGYFRETHDAVRNRLVEQHGFVLSDEDLQGIEYVHLAFATEGPQLTYSFGTASRMSRWRRMPTYEELMVQTDMDGVPRGYLSSESAYAALRDLQMRNLIVPVVGDFAGERALRAVGRWVRDQHATVTAFYTSNVEQYLFQSPRSWRAFYANVATMPLDAHSTFVRAAFNRYAVQHSPWQASGPRSVTLLSPIGDLLKAVDDGRVSSYYDVIEMSH